MGPPCPNPFIIDPEELGTHVLIACFPKSASTYLKNMLVALTGFKSGNLAYAYFQNEQDLYLPYKPKRRTKAQIAREAGLAPLAEGILQLVFE